MTPALPAMMRQLVKPEVVNQYHWAKTFEAYGWTPEMIADARDAEIERRLRECVEVGDVE